MIIWHSCYPAVAYPYSESPLRILRFLTTIVNITDTGEFRLKQTVLLFISGHGDSEKGRIQTEDYKKKFKRGVLGLPFSEYYTKRFVFSGYV